MELRQQVLLLTYHIIQTLTHGYNLWSGQRWSQVLLLYLLYVDDSLCVYHDRDSVLNKGTKVWMTKMYCVVWAWTMSLNKYNKKSVGNCEKYSES